MRPLEPKGWASSRSGIDSGPTQNFYTDSWFSKPIPRPIQIFRSSCKLYYDRAFHRERPKTSLFTHVKRLVVRRRQSKFPPRLPILKKSFVNIAGGKLVIPNKIDSWCSYRFSRHKVARQQSLLNLVEDKSAVLTQCLLVCLYKARNFMDNEQHQD